MRSQQHNSSPQASLPPGSPTALSNGRRAGTRAEFPPVQSHSLSASRVVPSYTDQQMARQSVSRLAGGAVGPPSLVAQ